MTMWGIHPLSSISGETTADVIGLKNGSVANPLSRWLTLPPEASLFVYFIFAPALTRYD
jgi:hypothetical protein